MAYERTWQFSTNNSYTHSSTLDLTRWQLWWIKAFLKGDIGGATQGLWSVVGSSNGVTAALDGVDRWSGVGGQFTSYDATTASNIIRAAAGSGVSNANSWIILRSPVTPSGYRWDMCLSFTVLNGTANDYTINIRWTKSTNGFSLAGTATYAPVGVTGHYWGHSSTNTAGTQTADTAFTAATRRMSGMLSANGDFLIFCIRQLAGFPEFSIATMTPASYRVEDTHPVWCHAAYNLNANVQGGSFGTSTATGPAPVTTYGHHYVEATTTLTTITIPNPAHTVGGNLSDPINGKYLDFPCWLLAADGTRLWMRGRLADIGILSAASYVPVGLTGQTVRDGSNNVIYNQLGSFLIPGNTAIDIT